MTEAHTQSASAIPEFPNIVSLLVEKWEGKPIAHFLHQWESLIFAFIVMAIIGVAAYFATRRMGLLPGRFQNAAEVFVAALDAAPFDQAAHGLGADLGVMQQVGERQAQADHADARRGAHG